MRIHIKTAESVTIGHPDKLADLISNTILDLCLSEDKNSRVACEVMITKGKCLVAGEITTTANVDYIGVAREAIEFVGYSADGMDFECRIHEQSPDIKNAVDSNDEVKAGDQGIVYGYATDELSNFMPLTIEYAHRLTDRLTEVREKGIIDGLLPDGKSQVSAEYWNDKFVKVTNVTVSAQHTEDKDIDVLRAEIKEKVIDYVFADTEVDDDAEVLINPSGRFVIGGFEGDTGLTGRKLMVDSYGGNTSHGGGNYNGKDASKVDRSGAYMARYIAKNIVASRLAEECEVAISYAIGKAEPTSINIDTFYTGIVSDKILLKAIKKVFDLTPQGIIDKLDLLQPIYGQTSSGGHFGHDYYMWEIVDKVEELKSAVKED